MIKTGRESSIWWEKVITSSRVPLKAVAEPLQQAWAEPPWEQLAWAELPWEQLTALPSSPWVPASISRVLPQVCANQLLF